MNGYHFFFNAAHHFSAVVAFQHHHNTANSIFLPIVCHGSVSHCAAEAYFGNIFYENGNAVWVCFHDNVFDVVKRTNQPNTANEIGIWFFINVCPACVLVVFFKRRKNFGNGNVHRQQFVGINRHFILFELSAKGIYLCNAGCSVKLPRHNPVLHGAQIHGRIFFFASFLRMNYVLVHFAQS